MAGTEPQPPTLAEVVRRAVEICDPAGESPDLERLLARFEDRDDILRLAARAEFDGNPPPNVAGWHAAEGVAA